MRGCALNAPGSQRKNTSSDEPAQTNLKPAGVAGSTGSFWFEVSSSPQKFIPLLLIMFLIAVSDQIVKAVIVNQLRLYDSINVIPGILSIMRIHNSGIAFGLFPGMPDVFSVMNFISIFAVFYFYASVSPRTILLTAACGLIMGGAVGNLIDRVRMGYVVDFINFSFWPAFNVADSAISIGVALLMISFFRGEKGTELDVSNTS